MGILTLNEISGGSVHLKTHYFVTGAVVFVAGAGAAGAVAAGAVAFGAAGAVDPATGASLLSFLATGASESNNDF